MSPGAGNINTLLEVDPAVWTRWGNDYRFCRAIWVASLTMSVYDCLLCFAEEVRFLRHGSFNFNKLLYLVNRYWPMANLIFDNIVLTIYEPSERFCFAWNNFLCYSGLVMHLAIGLILILRIYAMYSRNRTLLVILMIMFLAQLVVEMLILIPNALRSTIFTITPIFTGCIPDNPATYLWTYWLPMTVLEMTLFGLAIRKSIQIGRNSQGRPVLLTVLLRDSIFYFGGVLTIIITNLLLWAIARKSLFDAFVGAAFAVHSVLGCRILLNLQNVVYGVPGETKLSVVTLSTFVARPSQYTDDIEL